MRDQNRLTATGRANKGCGEREDARETKTGSQQRAEPTRGVEVAWDSGMSRVLTAQSTDGTHDL